VSICQKHDYF